MIPGKDEKMVGDMSFYKFLEELTISVEKYSDLQLISNENRPANELKDIDLLSITYIQNRHK